MKTNKKQIVLIPHCVKVWKNYIQWNNLEGDESLQALMAEKCLLKKQIIDANKQRVVVCWWQDHDYKQLFFLQWAQLDDSDENISHTYNIFRKSINLKEEKQNIM